MGKDTPKRKIIDLSDQELSLVTLSLRLLYRDSCHPKGTYELLQKVTKLQEIKV